MIARRWFLAVLLMASALPMAADPNLPPARWWRRPEVVERLGITDDQQARLDQIFRSNASDLIDLKAEVDKSAVELRGELDQAQLNRQNIQRVAARLNAARSKLFERELMMLVEMRAVLSDTQWNRMRTALDNMSGPMQQRGMRQPQMRRGPMGNPRKPQ